MVNLENATNTKTQVLSIKFLNNIEKECKPKSNNNTSWNLESARGEFCHA